MKIGGLIVLGVLLILVVGIIISIGIVKYNEKEKALAGCVEEIGTRFSTTEILIQYCEKDKPSYVYICSDGRSPEGFRGYIGRDFKFSLAENHPCDTGNEFKYFGGLFNRN